LTAKVSRCAGRSLAKKIRPNPLSVSSSSWDRPKTSSSSGSFDHWPIPTILDTLDSELRGISQNKKKMLNFEILNFLGVGFFSIKSKNFKTKEK
jgi:hypothetical protein